nr:MAG TPA: hypothetical protein [Caudoviricetes sp.]DAS62454.1 MAG TPA: hypothetical protein [Caudoviricetes sp.]
MEQRIQNQENHYNKHRIEKELTLGVKKSIL